MESWSMPRGAASPYGESPAGLVLYPEGRLVHSPHVQRDSEVRCQISRPVLHNATFGGRSVWTVVDAYSPVARVTLLIATFNNTTTCSYDHIFGFRM